MFIGIRNKMIAAPRNGPHRYAVFGRRVSLVCILFFSYKFSAVYSIRGYIKKRKTLIILSNVFINQESYWRLVFIRQIKYLHGYSKRLFGPSAREQNSWKTTLMSMKRERKNPLFAQCGKARGWAAAHAVN